VLGKPIQAVFSALGALRGIAFDIEQGLQGLPNVSVVVDDKHGSLRAKFLVRVSL
jgi:hypothetical protein